MAEPRTRESSRRLCGRSLPRSSRNLPHHCQTDTRENLQSCAVFFEFAHLCSQKQTLGSISYPDGQAPLACWLQGCLSFLPWKRGWWGCEGGKQLGEHTYLHSLSHTHTHTRVHHSVSQDLLTRRCLIHSVKLGDHYIYPNLEEGRLSIYAENGTHLC